ncbi:hypothetical protein [Microcystis aeruginosa]|uniref:hypothetical protein n=1 Tax=Microcystis aeruginosa TaxID=1126 RepID=UPI0010570304|nr:hypothetical protein [Microcystis aeruginosa]WNF13389.1 hypothetical protein RKE53_14830 [Microcystis aeruginosa NRERC-214]
MLDREGAWGIFYSVSSEEPNKHKLSLGMIRCQSCFSIGNSVACHRQLLTLRSATLSLAAILTG